MDSLGGFSPWLISSLIFGPVVKQPITVERTQWNKAHPLMAGEYKEEESPKLNLKRMLPLTNLRPSAPISNSSITSQKWLGLGTKPLIHGLWETFQIQTIALINCKWIHNLSYIYINRILFNNKIQLTYFYLPITIHWIDTKTKII